MVFRRSVAKKLHPVAAIRKPLTLPIHRDEL
jgi:hypothetical protein